MKNYLDYLFHPPTLITLALFSLALVWALYDVGIAVGSGYLQLNTNQGNLGIYWIHGCCYFRW